MPLTRRQALRALAASAAASVLTTPGQPARAAPQTGRPAPDFTATDTKGAQHTLAAYRGKTVVLEWTNHECPYTGKHYATGNMQALQADATAAGVIWLTVVSSRAGEQGYVEAAQADAITAGRKAHPTAVVLDPNGTLGHLYDARTTPHMFVIDGAGTLVYMGAIDDRPTANSSSVRGARNYVREALDAVAAGRPVAVAATRPYGCSVKY
ncbi:MAG: redoxin domain-containing protein [Hyphomicrobiaceae bacterium]|nr:redoxin domain-containing protein [Hyphomicrobiaceae bacterium]